LQNEIKKQIGIKLTTKQKRRNEPAHTIQIKANGVLYRKGNAIFLTYDEKEENGLGASRTTLKIEPDSNKITVVRHGATQMKYIWERGKTSSTAYSTAFGTFDMEVFTNTIQIQIDEPYQAGLIIAKYRLLFGGERSDMEFRLAFEELE
jgi:uncharacterized beta-barrel protein YwiB (DUF1934 family)